MKNLISSFLLITFCLTLPAQKQGNIWYFGKKAGLDFNGGSPVSLTNGQTYTTDGSPVEGTSVISDSSGALLFYTNGMKIWNKNQQVMPDGDSILGNFSSTQGALIVPQPGSSRYFYVFTVDDFYEDNLKYGFRYSIVDICRDNGLGDVMPGLKNILMLDTVAEKLTAVRHANGTDYWIIVHKYYSDAFYSYRLTSTGIADSVISHIGSRHPNAAVSQVSGPAIGQMKVSPDGKKIALVNANGADVIAEYFDFDNSTGAVSSWVNLQTDSTIIKNYQYYGVSFSPDNSKLYIACTVNGNGIYQFDLNAGGGDSVSVRASMTKIAGTYNYFALQLGPDGKIYSTRSPFIGIRYVAAIDAPNNPGSACNYRDSAVFLNGDTATMGLPNFITAYDYSNTTYNCSKAGLSEIAMDNINVYPNPSANGWQLTVNSDLVGSAIEISDAEGRIVFTSEIKDTHTDLNFATESGFYLMRIYSGGNSIFKKLVKQ